MIFFFVPSDSNAPTGPVLDVMASALRCHPGQRMRQWQPSGVGVGALGRNAFDPVLSDSLRAGHLQLWIFGDVFAGGSFVSGEGLVRTRQSAFRHALVERVARQADWTGVDSLDGEYWIAVWDARDRTLTLVNDRFGGLPLYWTETPSGFFAASGVRGVVAGTGAGFSPDAQALRQAVSFGGFRLGARTNVQGVSMFAGASVVRVGAGRSSTRRYWDYAHVDAAGQGEPRGGELALRERASELWIRSIERRMLDDERGGQTLSGGLDSRAILGEASNRDAEWATLTYGLAECDDIRLARRAAKVASAPWHYHSLYETEPLSWLERRSEFIQQTDGLIELGDLMHVETIHRQRELMDVHFSGYLGDAVCGPTFTDVHRLEDLFRCMPYYSTEVGLDGEAAGALLAEVLSGVGGAQARFALFENKLPQSTNRWTAAWRPWIDVRKPFVDYELFDFWQALPLSVRGEHRLYERCLVDWYPDLFTSIPNQATGVPVLSSTWRHQSSRVLRYAGRRLRAALGARPRPRNYRDERSQVLEGGLRPVLQELLCGAESLCGEILGRERVASVLTRWLDTGRAPDQTIGAMVVFEHYWRHLPQHVSDAQTTSAILNERVGSFGSGRRA